MEEEREGAIFKRNQNLHNLKAHRKPGTIEVKTIILHKLCGRGGKRWTGLRLGKVMKEEGSLKFLSYQRKAPMWDKP